MSRKKQTEQPPADFSNNPFKSLKGYTARAEQAPSGPRPVRKQNKLADDVDLFLREAAGARKLHDAALDHGEPAAPVRKEHAPAVQDRDAFLQAMKKMGAVAKAADRHDEDFPESAGRSKSSRMKQLKRGAVRISAEADLHGFLREEALAALGRFITAAHAQGRDAVLVITGKGINSPDGPVLQGAVAEWLRTKGKGMVAEFAPAPREKGGSGAFVVFLRKT